MRSNFPKYYQKYLSILLIFSVLLSSFGITFYLHQCKTSGNKTISVLYIDHCEHESLKIHSCCNNNKDCLQSEPSQSSFTETDKKLSKDCCTFDEENFKLSQFYFIDKFQKLFINSESYQQFLDFVNSSKTIDKLELYYKNFDNLFRKPIKNLIKFLSLISSNTSQNEESVS